jgi:AcrR family transcriptional regulator
MERLSRKQQTEANQQRLLDAALEVFTERGFHGATLEQIAAAAGFTTGVVYSRFASKADLFLALLERTIDQRVDGLRRMARGKTGEVGLAITRSWRNQVRKQPAWLLVVIEFRVHAARDPELNARYAELHQRHVKAFAAAVAHDFGRHGSDAQPSTEGALMMLALGSGLVLERWALGDEALGDLLERAVATMWRGMAAPSGARERRRNKG